MPYCAAGSVRETVRHRIYYSGAGARKSVYAGSRICGQAVYRRDV